MLFIWFLLSAQSKNIVIVIKTSAAAALHSAILQFECSIVIYIILSLSLWLDTARNCHRTVTLSVPIIMRLSVSLCLCLCVCECDAHDNTKQLSDSDSKLDATKYSRTSIILSWNDSCCCCWAIVLAIGFDAFACFFSERILRIQIITQIKPIRTHWLSDCVWLDRFVQFLLSDLFEWMWYLLVGLSFNLLVTSTVFDSWNLIRKPFHNGI